MMETLDSGIGSRSPTPDSSHSQMNSSKVTKVTTHTNHINNNSHNNTSSSNGTYSSKSKGSSSEKSEASSTIATTSNSGGGKDDGSSNNQTNGSSSGNHHHGNNTSNNAKTYRDYNNRHSSGHGQYKKYASQNQHYGYGGHTGHYQRYNNNTHRNYGNKHYHNSNYHHNNHHHYQGQGYQHHYNYGQQNHHQAQNNSSKNNGSNPITSTTNNSNNSNSSDSNSHQHTPQHQHHHHNNGHHHHQYFHHPHPGTAVHHHHRNVPPPPQVFISSDSVDTLSWQRQAGEENNAANWSSPNLESVDSPVQISLNLSALKQGVYSPSPQNASPAISPSTTDSSDAYSLLEDPNISGNNGVVPPKSNGAFNYPNNGGAMDAGLNGTIGPLPHGNPFPYPQYHPGFYTYPSANNAHSMFANQRSLSHQQQLIAASQNYQGLLIPADTSYTLGKADSSTCSSGSEKTVEWSDEVTYYPVNTDREDFINSPGFPERCLTPDFIYTPMNIPSGPIAAGKKRYCSSSSEKKCQILAPLFDLSAGYSHYSKLFYNGTASASGKLSPATQNQRFHHYSRKMVYPPHGFPREFFEDLDPEDYVRAFSKFGEVKERPAALKSPQCDSLSETIWLKFVENQQTTQTFRKKMELWRDVYRIVRNLAYNAHFKHDPRNFPTFGLQVVGSTMSGFGSNTSDVDMCLLVRGSDVDQRYEAVDKLQVLYGALSATQWLDNVELIYAKVPILKFRDPKKSLEVDLNCNNFVGIRNTHLLYCYSQADWRLKPLVLVVKLWAHYHGINDAKNMTISSYSLVLMVIHFLQCGVEEPVLPVLQQMFPDKFSNTTNILHVKINEILPSWQSKNKESIGNLLIQFLEYYAHKFDYSENAVSVRTGGTIPTKQAAAHKSTKNDPHQWKYLCIEEPFDRTNTARSVYDRDTFDKIVGIYNLSYQRLLASRNLEEIFAPIPETDARAMAVLLR